MYEYFTGSFYASITMLDLFLTNIFYMHNLFSISAANIVMSLL